MPGGGVAAPILTNLKSVRLVLGGRSSIPPRIGLILAGPHVGSCRRVPGSLTSHSVPEFAAAETERKQQFGRTPSPAAAAKVGRRTDLAIYQYRDRPCAYHFKAVTWCCRPASAPDAFLAIDPVASLRPARRSAVAVSCPGLSMATGARVPSNSVRQTVSRARHSPHPRTLLRCHHTTHVLGPCLRGLRPVPTYA